LALGGVDLPRGGEQDALAESFKKRYTSVPFAAKDSPAAQDLRIQYLSVRSDNVLN